MKIQISRIEKMIESLYDDKLAGEISKEKYENKKSELSLQKRAIEQQIEKNELDASTSLESRINVLKLSQKAPLIYQQCDADEKRLILSKLFNRITMKGGQISVEYTSFVKAIAYRVVRTNQILMEN